MARYLPPKNNYSPAEDVQIGRQAASQAEQQFPILKDDGLTSYVSDVGRRLVNAIPAELQHPEFQYSFKVVNMREINAFALPGGPMYVNRGMVEAAKTEGEVAGVMAHELSHLGDMGRRRRARQPSTRLGHLPGRSSERLSAATSVRSSRKEKLAAQVSAYWVNFATTGDPNGKSLPKWDAYQTKDDRAMGLADAPAMIPVPNKAALDFLDAFTQRSQATRRQP